METDLDRGKSDTGGSKKYLKAAVSRLQIEMKKGIKPMELNAQEHEILRLLSQGFSVNKISEKMNLSHRTVEFIVAEIKCKIEKSGMNLAELIESKE